MCLQEWYIPFHSTAAVLPRFCVLIILDYARLLVTYALKTDIFHFPGVEKVVVLKLVFAAN